MAKEFMRFQGLMELLEQLQVREPEQLQVREPEQLQVRELEQLLEQSWERKREQLREREQWQSLELVSEKSQLKKEQHGLTHLDPLISLVSKFFSQRQQEEWLGELYEVLGDMKGRQVPVWKIRAYCLRELIHLFFAAARLKLSSRSEKTGD